MTHRKADRTIIVRSPCDCRIMTAQYPCHFTGTARASCGDLAIAVRGPYNHRNSLRSSCDFFCTAWFLFDLVGNPEDWFSHYEAHFIYHMRLKHSFFILQNDQQKPCVLRTIAVRPPCNARTGIVRCSYDVSTGYVSTILIFLYNSELNKIVEATTTLRRPKTIRYRTNSVRRSHENGNLGIVRSL